MAIYKGYMLGKIKRIKGPGLDIVNPDCYKCVALYLSHAYRFGMEDAKKRKRGKNIKHPKNR